MGQTVSSENDSNGISDGSRHVKDTSNLAIYEQYNNQVPCFDSHLMLCCPCCNGFYMIIVLQGRGNAVHSNGVSSAGDGVDEKPYDIRHS